MIDSVFNGASKLIGVFKSNRGNRVDNQERHNPHYHQNTGTRVNRGGHQIHYDEQDTGTRVNRGGHQIRYEQHGPGVTDQNRPRVPAIMPDSPLGNYDIEQHHSHSDVYYA